MYLGVAVVLLITQPRRLALWEAAVALTFGVLGWRYLRQTPLLFLATAPMLAARLTWLTQVGIDARAMLVTAIASALLIARIPVTTMASEVILTVKSFLNRSFPRERSRLPASAG